MSAAGESSAEGAAFLQQLRNATAAQHQQLEGNHLSTALMGDAVSMQQYVQYLLKMQGIMAFYDNTILPVVAEVIPDAALRKKSSCIQQDLDQIGGDYITVAQPYQPIIGEIGLPFALGYMYVNEGSTLGGRVILKHISKHLPVGEGFGAAFFSGYGADTAAYWKGFIQILAVQAQHAGYAQQIINGANNAFATIHTHFEHPG